MQTDLELISIVGPKLYRSLAKLRNASFETADQSEPIPLADVMTMVLAEYFSYRMRPKEGPEAREPRQKGVLPRYMFAWLRAEKDRMEIAQRLYDADPGVSVNAIQSALECDRNLAVEYLRHLRIADMFSPKRVDNFDELA
jgi:hypothetical protein